MKDFLGRELAEGDKVIFITPGYRDYSTGRIERFTKCYAVVAYKRGQWVESIKQTGDQLIKV